MNISTAIIKDYDKEQRTINDGPYSKQSQTKPILERINVNFCATGYYESKPGIRVAGKPKFAVRRIRPERDGKQKVIWMHREIIKAGDQEFCDHINHNGLDDRKANLRLATRSQNAWNRQKAKIKSRSKYKGVSWYNRGKRWNARIQVNRINKFLGIFADEIEAAKAYDRAADNMRRVSRTIVGVTLIILGVAAALTPFSPGSWLALIGLEILGLGILIPRKLRSFLPRKYRDKARQPSKKK